jgi:hypothetical protein
MSCRCLWEPERDPVGTLSIIRGKFAKSNLILDELMESKMFNDFIKYYFRHQRPPGSVYVERDAYQLLQADGTGVIDRSNWSIYRGVVIEMSAIVQWQAPLKQTNARCPGCRSREISRSKGKWFEWKALYLIQHRFWGLMS